MTKKTNFYLIWAASCFVLLGVILYFLLLSDDKSMFLIGETTSGHYQIELKCENCHTQAFNDREDIQAACTSCHADELQLSDDSHPKSKFTDPRNAEYIDIIDARYCVSCHTEHQENRTLSMGLTLPKDYCFYCHQDIAEDRPSHEGFSFDGCASAGCHNFHDNRALYEDFLKKHLQEPKTKPVAKLLERDTLNAYLMLGHKAGEPVTVQNAEYPKDLPMPTDTLNAALTSSHAMVGVNCYGCHQLENASDIVWKEKPSERQCYNCHDSQTKGFLSGKHGMRLSSGLTPMTPKTARLPMKADAADVQLSCNSCHKAHDYNVSNAAITACLACHDDKHSLSYINSPHHALWRRAQKGEISESEGVSCTSCHMPREQHQYMTKNYTAVQHNQNNNLRPNEKMIRNVCMHCHGLAFSIDALADPELISNNFSSMPSKHIQSIDMVKQRK